MEGGTAKMPELLEVKSLLTRRFEITSGLRRGGGRREEGEKEGEEGEEEEEGRGLIMWRRRGH